MAEWSSKAQRSRDEPGQEKRYLPDILPVLGKLEPYEAPKRIAPKDSDYRWIGENLWETQQSSRRFYEDMAIILPAGEEERRYGFTCVMG